MRTVNGNVVQGCLPENYFPWKIITQNILDTLAIYGTLLDTDLKGILM